MRRGSALGANRRACQFGGRRPADAPLKFDTSRVAHRLCPERGELFPSCLTREIKEDTGLERRSSASSPRTRTR
jgi:hypothetical protein